MPEYRPPVRLVGEDGNAFNILARCRRAAQVAIRDGYWTAEDWIVVRDEMTAGDYDHLLGVAMDRFEVS